MQCNSCGFISGEDDHRCLRCGRRLKAAAGAGSHGYSGANALAYQPVFEALATPVAESTAQPELFAADAPVYEPLPKLIPFEQVQRRAGRTPEVMDVSPVLPVKAQAPPRTYNRRAARPADEQGNLDLQAGVAARTTKSNLQPQIECPSRVAPISQRMTAGAIDTTMILIGFGMFMSTAIYVNGSFGDGKWFWIAVASGCLLSSLLYGLMFAVSGSETPGMKWTGLQLITFDGHRLDATTRAVRFASSWVSFGAGGLGMLWAMADEENLAWHDHISKTFPTAEAMRAGNRVSRRA